MYVFNKTSRGKGFIFYLPPTCVHHISTVQWFWMSKLRGDYHVDACECISHSETCIAAVTNSMTPNFSGLQHQSFLCVACLSWVYCGSGPRCLQSGTQDDEANSRTIARVGKETY